MGVGESRDRLHQVQQQEGQQELETAGLEAEEQAQGTHSGLHRTYMPLRLLDDVAADIVDAFICISGCTVCACCYYAAIRKFIVLLRRNPLHTNWECCWALKLSS